MHVDTLRRRGFAAVRSRKHMLVNSKWGPLLSPQLVLARSLPFWWRVSAVARASTRSGAAKNKSAGPRLTSVGKFYRRVTDSECCERLQFAYEDLCCRLSWSIHLHGVLNSIIVRHD